MDRVQSRLMLIGRMDEEGLRLRSFPRMTRMGRMFADWWNS
jgi:hypothetical protein